MSKQITTKKRYFSIKEKLILNFVIFGLIIVIIVSSYSYYSAQKALKDRTFNQLVSLRIAKKTILEQMFSDIKTNVNSFATSSIKQELFDNSINLSDSSLANKIQSYFEDYKFFDKLIVCRANSEYNSFSLQANTPNKIDKNEKEIAICKKITKEKKTLLTDLISTDSSFYLYLGVPAFNNKKIVGTLLFRIPITIINNILLEKSPSTGLGYTGEIYLVGKDNLMRSESRFVHNSIMKQNVNTTSISKAKTENEGTEIIIDYRNKEVFSSFCKLNIMNLEWILLAEIDVEETYTPLYTIRKDILLISSLIALLLFIAAFIMSMQIISPINKLKEAAIAISKGEFPTINEQFSDDEIGSLVKTFNDMSLNLKTKTDQLNESKLIEEKLNSEKINAVIDGQEQERQRLSRDIHDGLGQTILAIKMKLENTVDLEAHEMKNSVEEIKEMFNNVIDETRNISQDLMPPELIQFGIISGINKLCRDTSLRTKIKVAFTSDENITIEENSRLKIYLYRIVQEALNNIIKHSEATNSSITMSLNENLLILNIFDNGKGFDTNNYYPGNGLYNIRTRVSLLNGNLQISSNTNEGTKINISIPHGNKQN